VFRWTGVAAPVQRRVWGIPPLVAAGSQILAIAPRMSGRGSRCAHLGSEDGLRGLISMAVASSLAAEVAAGFCLPVAALCGTRSLSVTGLGHRSTPLSAGRLRMHPA